MAMGSFSILMVMYMRGSGAMGRLTGEGSITEFLVQHTMGIGKMIFRMERVLRSGLVF